MAKKMIFVFCVFCFGFFLLFIRLGSLATDSELAKTGLTQSTYTINFYKSRGQIYDCRLISFTDQDYSLKAVCLPTNENEELLLKAGLILDANSDNSPLKTKLPFITNINNELAIGGVTTLSVAERYPENPLALHITGYVDSDKNGVCGIEKAYDEFLSKNSQFSTISYTVDAKRKPIKGISPVLSYAPIIKSGVVLTIDQRIQKICEKVGSRLLEKGAIVIMEPETGKIKGCASFPTYSLSTLEEDINNTEDSPMINRAFCAYNVGSVFKIVTAAATLESGISTDYTYTCNGATMVKDQRFRCHLLSGHQSIDLKEALKQSCNPYFIELSSNIDTNTFYNMARDLSFSKESVFYGSYQTQSGTLPSLETDLINPAEVANLSFGQGKLTATPIQIAQMMCAVINGGNTPQALLVEGTTSDGITIDRIKASAPVKAFSQETADILKDCLVACVMDQEKQNAKPQYVTAGGKTGTAQTGIKKEDGSELLYGWFAGFFPAEDPQYVAVVLSEDADSGNKDASPVFKEIADELYKPIKMPEINE